jgi:signal transduction histidine kinase
MAVRLSMADPMSRNGATLAGPLAILASIAGATQAFPWIGAACAVAIVAGAGQFVAPLLAKLVAALLMPLVAGWIVGRLAPRLLPLRLRGSWVVAWICAFVVLGLGLYGAVQLHRHGFTPAELIAFTRLEMIALPALVWVGAMGLPLAILQRQAYRAELAELRLSAVNAELKALQAQVEPHFLYNTLANTRYLARHQPERAVEMLDHLIAYLHQALPDMRSRTSNVARECDLAGHYLALMAIRFGERLRYNVHVADDVAEAEMPPLLLISLVENAVRHGVEAMPGTVTVEVQAARAGDKLSLTVTDDGPGPGASNVTGNGVGLRNAVDRLRALYGDAASLALTRGPDQRTCAGMLLPLRDPRSNLSRRPT